MPSPACPNWRPQVATARRRTARPSLPRSAREQADVRGRGRRPRSARLNGEPGELDSWRGLDALIQDQYWRAAHFRVAADDINYRRFFNINELAGLRMELPEVFDHAHRLVFRLLRDGTSRRSAHRPYRRAARSQGLSATAARRRRRDRFYLVVEKILARHETLREDWPVEGTTGYEFANLVLGLLVDPAGEEGFTRLYAGFTGTATPFAEIVRDCKLRIMSNEMASELNVLARDAARVARQNPRTADFTRNILHRALREIVACFPVYRTYVDADGECTADADRRDLDWAIAQARRNETDMDPERLRLSVQAAARGDLVAEAAQRFQPPCGAALRDEAAAI